MPIRVCTIYAEVGPPERKYGKQGKKGEMGCKEYFAKTGVFFKRTFNKHKGRHTFRSGKYFYTFIFINL